ncbi:uncharacterized protein LOC132265103 [Phlebotomus argentipes]|uniref:uncharacterized protein LOC132265103 n=1 Tax=Phlebotomus argentipes TaxID=94469 RepID=UPI002892C8C0|nr:uncharacterized protein LOC132265103 [Phlebotomus argentipes]
MKLLSTVGAICVLQVVTVSSIFFPIPINIQTLKPSEQPGQQVTTSIAFNNVSNISNMVIYLTQNISRALLTTLPTPKDLTVATDILESFTDTLRSISQDVEDAKSTNLTEIKSQNNEHNRVTRGLKKPLKPMFVKLENFMEKAVDKVKNLVKGKGKGTATTPSAITETSKDAIKDATADEIKEKAIDALIDSIFDSEEKKKNKKDENNELAEETDFEEEVNEKAQDKAKVETEELTNNSTSQSPADKLKKNLGSANGEKNYILPDFPLRQGYLNSYKDDISDPRSKRAVSSKFEKYLSTVMEKSKELIDEKIGELKELWRSQKIEENAGKVGGVMNKFSNSHNPDDRKDSVEILQDIHEELEPETDLEDTQDEPKLEIHLMRKKRFSNLLPIPSLSSILKTADDSKSIADFAKEITKIATNLSAETLPKVSIPENQALSGAKTQEDAAKKATTIINQQISQTKSIAKDILQTLKKINDSTQNFVSQIKSSKCLANVMDFTSYIDGGIQCVKNKINTGLKIAGETIKNLKQAKEVPSDIKKEISNCANDVTKNAFSKLVCLVKSPLQLENEKLLLPIEFVKRIQEIIQYFATMQMDMVNCAMATIRSIQDKIAGCAGEMLSISKYIAKF